MHKSWRLVFFVMAAAVLLLAACGPATPIPSPTPSQATAAPAVAASPTPLPAISGPSAVKVTGSFDYTNDIITTYYVEQAVALVDMYGFVTRNRDWEIPVESQVLGYLKIDP
jgi:curli biogenesis system outer membrane secretion channel CsgG